MSIEANERDMKTVQTIIKEMVETEGFEGEKEVVLNISRRVDTFI